MKTLSIIMLIYCCTALTACNFSKGAKKDLSTGLSYNYNGFSVRNVLLIDASGTPLSSNKVSLNTRVSVAALGIINYGLKDGKVYPGMMLAVTDQQGIPVIKSADLFAGGKGYPPAGATELRGDITIAQPMASGQAYHVNVRIWDKVKAGNEIDAEAELVVQ